MKKSKLLVVTFMCMLSLFLVTGCASKTTKDEVKKDDTKETSKLKAKCSALECIKKIEPENTVEEVNEIVGVEGKLTSEEYNIYEYDLGNDEKITLKYYSGTKATIIADYDRDSLADKKVDLSNLQVLKSKVSAGITYDEFKNEIGGSDGTLIEKSSTSNKYVWVSKKGGYVTGSFRIRDNKCSFFSGYGDSK